MADGGRLTEAGRFVSFDGVSKRYAGDVWAVRDLDLEISRGEFVTLLGPSGSGKTTSLMMLAGFETPSQGDILLGGRSLREVPAYRRDIGVVFQNYALFPHMTVAENVAFPLSVRKTGKAETAEAVKRALDLVRLSTLGERMPAQLSGGQQQRVALARALVFNPPLVLMDEPLGALDRQLREHMQIEIKHLHARLGVTLVYVTHDQGEALTMSDRVAVFRDGRLEQVASPESVYERPETSFVAQFLGDSNQFGATVLGREGGFCQVELDGGWRLGATAGATAAKGARCTVSVRPERLTISEAAGAETPIPATVEELIYYGDLFTVVLRLPDGRLVTTKTLSGGQLAGLAPGQALYIGWRAADGRALDPLPEHAA